MSKPKRHHYIPKMLQKRFINRTGGLWVYNREKPERGVIALKPEDAFVERHLYSTLELDGSRSHALESRYSQIESDADPIIEKICLAARERRNPNLSPTELDVWNHFFFHQQKRVPDFFGGIDNIKNFPDRIDEALDAFEDNVSQVPARVRELFKSSEFVERFKKNAIVGSLFDPSPMVQNALRSRGLALAVLDRENRSFLLGSNPMARLGVRNGSSLDNPEVELWLPIARDVAVSPYGKPGELRIQVLNDHQLRKINHGIFSRSTVVASGSKDLIESLRFPR